MYHSKQLILDLQRCLASWCWCTLCYRSCSLGADCRNQFTVVRPLDTQVVTLSLTWQKTISAIPDICHCIIWKYPTKYVNSKQYSKKWPKFCVLNAKKYASLKKLHHRQSWWSWQTSATYRWFPKALTVSLTPARLRLSALMSFWNLPSPSCSSCQAGPWPTV